MYMPPDLNILATTAISQLEATTADLHIDKNFISAKDTVKKNVVPIEIINRIITAVATSNTIKTNKIIDEYNVDSLAKLRFDFKTTNNITYKNINLFFLACRSGNIIMAQELIDNPNININELSECDNGTKGRTALILASGHHTEIVKLLLEHNADTTIKDEYGADVIQYSLAMGANNIDRCYEIQTLLHNHKKKLNITSDCRDLQAKTADADSCITFCNNNQNFIITFFYKDDNNNITNIESRSNNIFIQKFLDSFKPYVITDLTQPPVTDNIKSCMDKKIENFKEHNHLSIDCDYMRSKEDPNIIDGIKVTTALNQEQQNKISSNDLKSMNVEISIPIPMISSDNEHPNLTDNLMRVASIFNNKNKSDIINIIYSRAVLSCLIQDFISVKNSFPESSNKLPDNLSDIENYPEYQQLEAIDELIYIAINLSSLVIFETLE